MKSMEIYENPKNMILQNMIFQNILVFDFAKKYDCAKYFFDAILKKKSTKKFSAQFFFIFFRIENYFRFFKLNRSKSFQRIQKSYLESRTTTFAPRHMWTSFFGACEFTGHEIESDPGGPESGPRRP